MKEGAASVMQRASLNASTKKARHARILQIHYTRTAFFKNAHWYTLIFCLLILNA